MDGEFDRHFKTESLLVKASMGLIRMKNTADVVQHLADAALEIFETRYAVVGAFPAESRELKIVGFTKHPSVDEACVVDTPITGHGLFRPLYEGDLRPILCNDVPSHPTSMGYPEGHPEIKKVIIVPLVNQTMEMIGLFIVGDKLDGSDFKESDQILAERLTHYGSAAVAHARADEDRMKAESELEEARREHMIAMAHAGRLAAIGEMTAITAHELNQPLGSISNYLHGSLEELDSEKQDIEIVRKGLEHSRSLVERAKTIIQRLREFSRSGEDASGPVSIKEVVSYAADLLQPRIRKMGVSLIADIPEDFPSLQGDPLKLEQVFLNIMTNACDAMEDSAVKNLSVTAKTVNNEAEFSVTNTGAPISEKIGDKIFDAFYSTKPPESGQGLGLSICRSIIREYGGSIHVRNIPDGGTAFVFKIPLSRGHNAQ